MPETLTRTVESNTEQRVSKATFKGYQLTFTEQRQLGSLVSVTIYGYKQVENEPTKNVSLTYTAQNPVDPAISFTPATSVDAEIANAIAAELEVIKGDEVSE